MTPKQKKRLFKFCKEEYQQPFQWGFNDCNTFIARAIDYIFETTYSTEIVGKYWTQREAMNFQWQNWGKYSGCAEDKLFEIGAEKIDYRFRESGDILIVKNPRWDMAHLLITQNTIISPHRSLGVICTLIKNPENHIYWRIF